MQGLKPTVRNILEFLVYLSSSKGFNYNQVCMARSAVGVLSNIEDIGKHPDIKRMMKGLFEKKPQFPKYNCIWDVNILLKFFRTLPSQEDLSLELLSKKLAILISILAGGQRCQTIHSINVLDITVTNEKCIIPIYDPIKQTRPGKHMKPLEFKIYSEKKLCVVQNLTTYLDKTKSLRDSSKLFISYQKPHKPVSKDTITRWCNQMMKNAGIDTSKYVTHSCRAAASSLASVKGVHLKKILESCGWSSEHTFALHYRKDVEKSVETIGEALLH